MSCGKYFFPTVIVVFLVTMIVTNIFFQDIYTRKYPAVNHIYESVNVVRNHLLNEELKFSYVTEFRGNKSPNVTKPKPKIAYIFAGSARSFVCDKVHWSIRSHLIDAFGGESYTFVRIAIDDNRNIKTGLGTLWTPPYKDNEVNETLKILAPRVVQYFSFSNQVEEMKLNYPGLDHAVFRENDRRRYSMFYHRCMAYKLMTKYEKDNNLRFDWVVLVRLDAIWLEPVLPITSYQNDRVWITETGFDLFNDQFMLIPRAHSDYIYDLNTKVEPDVYCLGGPDVEKWKCKREELEKRGVSAAMVAKTLERCCEDRFTFDRRGASERIHFRHLRNGNIPVSTGRFPVALVRRRADTTCFVECFRLYTYQYKEYLFRFNDSLYPNFKSPTWPDTRGRTISARDKVACVLLDSGDLFLWQPVSAHKLHTELLPPEARPPLLYTPLTAAAKATPYALDYTKSLYDQTAEIHPSLLMNTKDLEAWRIHPTFNVEGCLTYSYAFKNLSWSRCNDHVLPHSLRYDPRQLFFLHVTPESPSEYDFSYRPQSQILPLGVEHQAREYTRIVVTDANPRDWEPRHPIQCLTALKVDPLNWKSAIITTRDCSMNWKEPNQLFYSVKGWTSGSTAFTTVGSMKFAADPNLCITRMEEKELKAEFLTVPIGDQLYLENCTPNGHLHLVLFEFESIRS